MNLIDRDKLIEELKEFTRLLIHFNGMMNPLIMCQKIKGIINEQPQVNQWIPCEERLPKCRWVHDVFNRSTDYMSEKVLVTVKTKNCDGTHYFVSTDIMTGKNETDVHWLMGGGYGGSAVYNQEIIAWQPLPAPFEEK